MISMVKNIAFIGDSESVKGFGAVGIDAVICDSPENAAAVFKKIAEKDRYAVVYITEELYEAAQKEIQRFSETAVPAVIPLPGARGNTGIGTKRLSAFVEQAVGSDILFK